MLAFLLAAVLGALSWPVFEYGFHRFAGHVWPSNPFGVQHLRHHREQLWFAPARDKAKLALLVLALATLVLTPVAGAWLALTYAAGLASAYLAYEALHKAIHTTPPRTAYGRWARRHHLTHHHADPRLNHGVTTHALDVVFGTWRPVEGPLPIVRGKAPPWLLTPGDEPWRADYVLRGKPAAEAEAAAG